jgi:hypothetical protein
MTTSKATSMRATVRRFALWLCIAVSACDGERPPAESPDAPPVDAPPAGAPPSPDTPSTGAAGTVHEYAYLLDEAEHLLAFLRGEDDLDRTLLADTVTLHVAPEAGVAPVRRAREQLADRGAWRVGPYVLVPPPNLPQVTAAPGLHFNCMPGDLAGKVPQLAGTPHVGLRLADAEEPTSCLRTWNLTLVFSGDAAAPRLTAVVYDQWEW